MTNHAAVDGHLRAWMLTTIFDHNGIRHSPKGQFQPHLDNRSAIELAWSPGRSGRFWPHKDAQRRRLLRIVERHFVRSTAK
jgi:hypothetical protein